jgi:Domain of unknown function (DUF4331)
MSRVKRAGPGGIGVLLAAGIALVVGATGVLLASDHQDTPEAELQQRPDINDVYAFPGRSPDRLVLAMTTASPITPAQGKTIGFDPNLLYQIKVDNTGDAVEDLVFQVRFEGEGPHQQVFLYGPVAPSSTGGVNKLVDGPPVLSGPTNTALGSPGGIQLQAGLFDDPFFIDLEQFFRIIPDRKPATGSLSQLPDAPSASSFRTAGQAVDYLRGLNTLAVVLELPVSQLTAGGNPKIGVWGTISR